MVRTNRVVKVSLLSVIAVLLFSACATPVSVPTAAPPTQVAEPTKAAVTAPPEKRTLVVSGWGGLWEESFLATVAKPFEAAHPGVEIVHHIGGSVSEMVAKLRAEIDNPTVDVVGTGAGFERVMADEGLVEDFDPVKMPNLKDVFPAGLYKNRIVANSFNGTGLAYHKDRVPRAPTSWYDLWDTDFSPVGIPDITNTAGYSLFDAINQLEGGSKDNVEPGWKKYEELIKTQKPVLYKNMSDEAMNVIVQRDGALIVAGNSRVIMMMKEGYPMGFVYPKEGALAWGTYMGVVKNSKNKDLAMEFINFWLDPAVNGAFCAMVNYGPSNSKARLPDDYAYKEYLMFGDSLDKARISDWDYLTQNLPQWTERWTTQVLPLYQ